MKMIKNVLLILCATVLCAGANEMNRERREIKAGHMYKHYKGNLYKVIAIAVDTEAGVINDYSKIADSQRRVIYYALNDTTVIWDRPYEMFAEKILIDGVEQWRFADCDVSE
ncbi:MAG: DUF1653 domain-containing protein [Candidatus Dependentiae bacterium]|nr:DUF1653 domain-containing protein [Candidatus Dependentiae bacterium]